MNKIVEVFLKRNGKGAYNLTLTSLGATDPIIAVVQPINGLPSVFTRQRLLQYPLPIILKRLVKLEWGSDVVGRQYHLWVEEAVAPLPPFLQALDLSTRPNELTTAHGVYRRLGELVM